MTVRDALHYLLGQVFPFEFGSGVEAHPGACACGFNGDFGEILVVG